MSLKLSGRAAAAAVGLIAVSGLAWGQAGELPAPAPAEAQAQPGPWPGPYAGHAVVRVRARTPADILRISALTDDFWTCEGPSLAEPFDVRVSPEQREAMRQAGIEFTTVIEDVQRFLDEHMADVARTRAGDAQSFFDTYRTRSEINTLMDQIAATYPQLASVSQIGTSFEGRPIRLIRLSGPDQPGNPRSSRPIVLVNGCQHAREWMALMMTCFFMDRLAEEYSTNERIRSVMDRVEFYIVPIVNPDGYDFTWTPNNRLWRKSRRTPPAGSTCFGVDLNRNWGFQWGLSTGSSGSPCSDTYRGAAPFSEPETTAMKNLIDPIAPRLRSHLDMHSNAQKFLSPWGYTTSPAPIDLPLMDLLGARMRAGILPYRNTAYEYGQGSVILYLNSGNARDYTYGTHRRMAWTWESTNSTGGFAPAASEIRPTSNESLDGFLRLAEYWAFPIVISLPGSAPALLPADAASELRVSITNDGGTVSPGTARLFTRVGATGAFTPAVMSNPAAGDFRGQLPAAPCGSEVQYYVEASTTAGETVRLPAGAPGRVFSARAVESQVLWSDACEAQGGWSLAAGSDTATAGRWVNAAPSATPAQPGADASPAPGTRCFITNGSASNNALDFDLDGGTTTLTGPSFSAAAPAGYNASDVFVAYSRWFSDNRGNAPDTNDLVVQISNDNGSTWTTLETVTADADAWVRREFRVSDFVAPTATMRLRFIARDSTNALVEAGIDEVSAFATRCGAPACPGDWNGDGVIDFNDLLEYLNDYNAQAPRADINLDGIVDFNDLLEYLNLYNAPC